MTPENNGLLRFEIDAKPSLFTVQAFAAGKLSAVVHSPKFAIRGISGEILYAPEVLDKGSLQMNIDPGSLEILDEVSGVDRREIERTMFDEVLERNAYPRIAYKSVQVNATRLSDNMARVKVAGDLTLHGITHRVDLDSQVVTGEDTLRAQGYFSIMQSDYGLKIACVAGGTLRLKDELKFAFFIMARRKL
ncbi:MAG TPA: YceI family protein [Candidatus Sulfotelmatobacter sp.]|nr:YceI family protein [Candidatus Sulfotelmatobacter sp.]